MKQLQNILTNSGKTFRQYPLVLLSAFISFMCLSIFVEFQWEFGNRKLYKETMIVLAKIAFTANLGISVFFVMKVAAERFGKVILFNSIGGILLLFFYFMILPKDFETDLQQKEIIYIVIFYLLSHLAIAFFPFIFVKNKEYNFWGYNKNLFLNFFISVVFTFVLSGGINLAMYAISELFYIKFSEQMYIHIGIFSGVFGNSFIFLSFCRNLSHLEKIENDYPIVLKFFTQFVLIPLLMLYGFILYLYGLKILISWTLPRGWISYMIIAYSVVGLLAYLLIYPLGKMNAKSWVQLFLKLFYFSLLPLLILLFVAIFTRVLEYGFTENRYFIVLFAIWLVFITLYFILWKKSSIRVIPISLFLFVLGSVTLPFLNVFSVSKFSQKRELEQLFSQTNILENGKINFDRPIADTMVDAISEKVYFLVQRDEKNYIMHFIPENKKEEISEENFHYFSKWNFRMFFTNIQKAKIYSDENSEAIVEESHYFINSSSITVPKGFNSMIYLDNEKIIGNNKIKLDYFANACSSIELTLSNGSILRYDLFESLKKQLEEKEQSPKVEFTLGKYDFVLIPNYMYYSYDKKNKQITEIEARNVILFYKEKQ